MIDIRQNSDYAHTCGYLYRLAMIPAYREIGRIIYIDISHVSYAGSEYRMAKKILYAALVLKNSHFLLFADEHPVYRRHKAVKGIAEKREKLA